jgi:hypothetical protein
MSERSMDLSPYQSPTQEQSPTVASPSRSRRRFLFTYLALATAGLASMRYIGRLYVKHREIELHGSVHTEWSPLDMLVLPGFFCFYVVYILTRSKALGYAAFLAAMTGLYGGCGLLIDSVLTRLGSRKGLPWTGKGDEPIN